MPGFYDPLWLCGLVLIPVLAGIYWYMIRKKRQEAMAFSRVAFVKSAMGDTKGSKLQLALFVLALAAIGLLVIGLADPHIPLSQTKEGMNVILVIDDSGSMQATDYQPSRIEAAKADAEMLVGNLSPQDAAGVIIFQDGATTAAYLSQDKEYVQEKIANISPSSGATAIGDGLALAVDMAQSAPDRISTIILLSDGVNNAGTITPEEATALAHSAGIPIDTIALGTSTPTILDYDWSGAPDYADLNETALKTIADQTGGRYFKSVNGETLRDAYGNLIPQNEPRPEETSIKDWFIFGVLILLCIELWLRYGKRRILP